MLYGNGSSHPFIHHDTRNKMSSLIWVNELGLFSKIRALRFFEIDHTIIKKDAAKTFLKNFPFKGGVH